MQKKLKLLFVVCLVSVVVVFSAGKTYATTLANASAQMGLQPFTEFLQPTGANRPIWKKSGSAALAAIPDVPAFVTDGPNILPGIVNTVALAQLPGGPGLFGSIALTNGTFSDPVIPPSVPGVMESFSIADIGWPHPGGFTGSVAAYAGMFNATARNGTRVGLTALDKLWIDLDTDYVGDVAEAFAVSGLFVKNLNTGVLSLDYRLIQNKVVDGGDYYLNTGILTDLNATAFFNYQDQGIWGAFVATGVKAEPVPEPTTIALLGIGLAGLAGAEVRRRRKKKAVDES